MSTTMRPRAPDPQRAVVLVGHEFKPAEPRAAEAATSTTGQLLIKGLSVRLKETYRKANPDRPVGNDAAPRRVLTHPSFPVSNGCAAAICVIAAEERRKS